jgi:hypothetical protein
VDRVLDKVSAKLLRLFFLVLIHTWLELTTLVLLEDSICTDHQVICMDLQAIYMDHQAIYTDLLTPIFMKEAWEVVFFNKLLILLEDFNHTNICKPQISKALECKVLITSKLTKPSPIPLNQLSRKL